LALVVRRDKFIKVFGPIASTLKALSLKTIDQVLAPGLHWKIHAWVLAVGLDLEVSLGKVGCLYVLLGK